jgi:hypothetical protein
MSFPFPYKPENINDLPYFVHQRISSQGTPCAMKLSLDGSSKGINLNVAEERIELRKFAPKLATLPGAPDPQGENNENG